MSLKNINILLVDDSVTIITRMKEILSEIKCVKSIDTATDGVEAYTKITKSQPHLVLLDINMPIKNGIELLKEIKQNFPKVKVIMVTNQSVEYYKPICIEMGAEYFIDKSTEFELIPNIIELVSAQIG